MSGYCVISPTAAKGIAEVSEAELYIIIGTEKNRPYANKVYRGEMTMDEVPEELREEVAAVVAEKVKRWGLYAERELQPQEALNIITGGDANEA